MAANQVNLILLLLVFVRIALQAITQMMSMKRNAMHVQKATLFLRMDQCMHANHVKEADTATWTPQLKSQSANLVMLATGVQIQHLRARLVLQENITHKTEVIKNQVAYPASQGIFTDASHKLAKIHARNAPSESTKTATVPCSA